MLLERRGSATTQGPVPGGFSDAGAVFPAGTVCQLLHPGLLCTDGSDGWRDGGGSGLCAGKKVTGTCRYILKIPCLYGFSYFSDIF